jgi:hypothetical protein
MQLFSFVYMILEEKLYTFLNNFVLHIWCLCIGHIDVYQKVWKYIISYDKSQLFPCYGRDKKFQGKESDIL